MSPALHVCMLGRTMPAHRGGCGMFHPYLSAQCLSARGHHVTVLTTSLRGKPHVEHPTPNFTLHYLANTPPDQYSVEFWNATARAAAELHATRPIDVLWSDSAGAFGLIACRTLSRTLDDVPLLTVCHAGATMSVSAASRALYEERMHALFDRSAVVLCVSELVRQSVIQGCPAAAPRTRVVLNGADLAAFQAAALRRAPNIHGPVRVIFVGRAVPEKGLDDLVRAAAMLPKERIAVRIVGPGPAGPAAVSLAAELGVDLEYTPGVPHDRVPDVLANADVCVLPTRHEEGLPFSLVEGCAAALPIVACDRGGVREVVEHGVNGLLVPSANPAALAAALNQLATDPALRARLSIGSARLASDRFSLSAMTTSLEDLLWSISRGTPRDAINPSSPHRPLCDAGTRA